MKGCFDIQAKNSRLVKKSCRCAFTLIEMLVATVLSAVLMSAVLSVLAGVSRDRKTLVFLNSNQSSNSVADLLCRDLTNARSMSALDEDGSIELIGLAGIDSKTLSPNGRLVEVTYQIQSSQLWRVQEYLDDPAHPGRWEELVTADVSSFSLQPMTIVQGPIPSRVRLRFATASSRVDQTLWMK